MRKEKGKRGREVIRQERVYCEGCEGSADRGRTLSRTTSPVTPGNNMDALQCEREGTGEREGRYLDKRRGSMSRDSNERAAPW